MYDDTANKNEIYAKSIYCKINHISTENLELTSKSNV